jgi:hypothetical protein
MWIKQETTLMNITGEEPSVVPTHLPTRMIVIDDQQKQMIRGGQLKFNLTHPIQPQIAEILQNNPDIEFYEAITFAVPIQTMSDVCSLTQTDTSDLVANFTHTFTKEQLYSQSNWMDNLFIAPKVMHHTMRLWLCFHIIQTPQTNQSQSQPQTQLITTTPGKKTSRYTPNIRPNNITRKVARNVGY